MSEVTGFKDTTHKDKKVPSCWSGIKFTDGSRCQISVAHKVLIYKGRTMFGGNFYDADAHDFIKDKPLTLLNGAELIHLLRKHGYNAKIDLKEAKRLLRTQKNNQ